MSSADPADNLLRALLNVYLTVRDEHSGQKYECECPTCEAVAVVKREMDAVPSANNGEKA